MNKRSFIEQLNKSLRNINSDERRNIIEYYSEIIDDKIENGMSEKEAVKELGSIDLIIGQCKSEYIMKNMDYKRENKSDNKKEKRPSNGRNIFILISLCTSIIWFPIAFAFIITLFVLSIAMFVVSLAVVVAIFALAISVIPDLLFLKDIVSNIDLLLAIGIYLIGVGTISLICYGIIKLFKTSISKLIYFFSRSINRKSKRRMEAI